MTNDELNRWYHEHLGKCVHKWYVFREGKKNKQGSSRDTIKCKKCDYKREYGSWHGPPDPLNFNNYLSNPAVILGTIVENGITSIWCDNLDGGKAFYLPEFDNETLDAEHFNRAVLLALKAKVENG